MMGDVLVRWVFPPDMTARNAREEDGKEKPTLLITHQKGMLPQGQ
jgi:hypothetical protein